MQNNSLHSMLNGEDVLVRNLSFSFFFIFIIFRRTFVTDGVVVMGKQTFAYVRTHTRSEKRETSNNDRPGDSFWTLHAIFMAPLDKQ